MRATLRFGAGACDREAQVVVAGVYLTASDDSNDACPSDPYGRFIAHARADVPWLLEQVERLGRVVE